MSNIYGVFCVIDGKPFWMLTRNKRKALAVAKQHGGYVGAITDAPEYHSFDAPTFRMLMTLVHDYRSAYPIGTRVELSPSTDRWMMGDRYGEVVNILRNGRLRVKLDKSGATRTFTTDLIQGVI